MSDVEGKARRFAFLDPTQCECPFPAKPGRIAREKATGRFQVTRTVAECGGLVVAGPVLSLAPTLHGRSNSPSMPPLELARPSVPARQYPVHPTRQTANSPHTNSFDSPACDAPFARRLERGAADAAMGDCMVNKWTHRLTAVGPIPRKSLDRSNAAAPAGSP
jgi:hypothetical protein